MNTEKILNDLDIVLDTVYKEARENEADYRELRIIEDIAQNTIYEVKALINEYKMYSYIIDNSDNDIFLDIAECRRDELNVNSKINDVVNRAIKYKFLDNKFIKITDENKEELEDRGFELYEIPF